MPSVSGGPIQRASSKSYISDIARPRPKAPEGKGLNGHKIKLLPPEEVKQQLSRSRSNPESQKLPAQSLLSRQASLREEVPHAVNCLSPRNDLDNLSVDSAFDELSLSDDVSVSGDSLTSEDSLMSDELSGWDEPVNPDESLVHHFNEIVG